MNPMTRSNTFAGSLDGLLNEFFRPAYAWDNAPEPLPAPVDVRESAEAYTVQVELAGVKKDEIRVEIEGNEVTISAETKRGATAEGEKWLRVERSFGKTARRLALPQEIDEGKAVAKFTDGVLELTLPKKAPALGRKIDIQ
ncbi:MAG: Hsp20/alpha crystallin family protein [Usitatibacter sp.]